MINPSSNTLETPELQPEGTPETILDLFLLGRLVIFNLMERESPPDQPVAVEEAPGVRGSRWVIQRAGF